jgi:hypothetical protein
VCIGCPVIACQCVGLLSAEKGHVRTFAQKAKVTYSFSIVLDVLGCYVPTFRRTTLPSSVGLQAPAIWTSWRIYDSES